MLAVEVRVQDGGFPTRQFETTVLLEITDENSNGWDVFLMCFSYKQKRTKTVFIDDIRKSKRKKGRKGDKKVLAVGGI